MYLLYVANVDCKSAFCLKIDHDNIKSIRSTNKHVQQQKTPTRIHILKRFSYLLGKKKISFTLIARSILSTFADFLAATAKKEGQH